MVAKAKKVEKTNNKNLITIVLLIVAGIVILSYTDSTGFVSKEGKTKIMVSAAKPPEIDAGEEMYITIEPGTKGYDGNTLDIYKKGTLGKKTMAAEVKVQYCGSTCKEERTLKYRTSTSWSGTYYASVKDLGTGKTVETSFKVVPK